MESDIKTLQENYWKQLTTELIDNYPEFKPKKPDRNAYYLPLGDKTSHISMKVNSRKNIQECKIVISHNKGLYKFLEKNKDQIEKRINLNLDWNIKEGVESHITLKIDFDIKDTSCWNDAIKWHLDMAHEFYFEFTTLINLYCD